LVVPEICVGDGPPRHFFTLNREPIRIGRGFGRGHHGLGRILATATPHRSVLHGVDSCGLPSSILKYKVEASTEPLAA